MLIAHKYEVPDKCPEECIFRNDFRRHGQNSICLRCPVLCCKEPTTEEEKLHMPIVSAKGFDDTINNAENGVGML